jgi:hypothetical protein
MKKDGADDEQDQDNSESHTWYILLLFGAIYCGAATRSLPERL